MNMSQALNSELADKQYIYRFYSRTLIIVLLFVNGIVTLIFGWLAVTNKQVVNWFSLFVFLTIFLYYCWIALLDAQNKFMITVAQTGIQLPAIWRRGSTAYLPFSSLSAMQLLKVRKDTILKLSMGEKIHVIFESCFPNRQDFNELIGIIQKQSPVSFSRDAE